MDLLDLLKLMFRRWYVTAPVVALTVGAALALGASIQPEYKTSAAVLLVPPTVSAPAPAPNAAPQPGNPWLRVGENAMAQAVQIAVSAQDARDKILAAGGEAGYEVTVINRSSILTLDITATTEARALTTVRELTKLVKEVVASQQAKYKPRAGEQITTEVLDPGLNITQSRSNVLRAQIVVVVVGLLCAAALAVLFDAIARRRAANRQGNRRRDRPAVVWPAGPATGRTPANGVAARAPGRQVAGDVPPGPAGRPPIPAPAVSPRLDETAPAAASGPQRVSTPNGRAFAPRTPNLVAGGRTDETALLGTARTPADGPAE